MTALFRIATNSCANTLVCPISHVIICAADGSYADSITKRVQMFQKINLLRVANKQLAWKIETVAGPQLIDALKAAPIKETLLVVPAGESTKLDNSFTAEQTAFIKNEF
ncbi:MAG TPA: hypothetical protein VN457_00790, partial [Chlamydiales bacterium]|nr:hypothetical protein [Chlamydiales bacterium]